MESIARTWKKVSGAGVAAAAMALMFALGAPDGARADEADAKRLVKAMADYMTEQTAISFEFDATLEVVTKENQKLALASSGRIILNRPGKLRATRSGGFGDIEVIYDGKMLTMVSKYPNLYSQVAVSGTVHQLIDELQNEHKKPLPGADLLMSSVYDELMRDVVDTKDLGSGVIDGVECDYLAFRTKDVDWQIWIAPGRPSLSLSLCHHFQAYRAFTAIPYPVQRLEDRKRGYFG